MYAKGKRRYELNVEVVNTSEKFGRSSSLGATLANGGVNFSLFSRSATGVDLLLFDHEDEGQPKRVICLDPVTNHTYHYWHVLVPGVEAGQIYGYRIQGPYDPSTGMRFDPAKVLLDPYGRCVVVPKNFSRDLASKGGDNAATAMKSVVIDPRAYDWEDDRPLNRPSSRTIIYEMHVRGFTCHPSSGVSEKKRGTFAGLVEKIAYLKELGVVGKERRIVDARWRGKCQEHERRGSGFYHRNSVIANVRRQLRFGLGLPHLS